MMVITMPIVLQGVYTNICSLICERDSRTEDFHCRIKLWSLRLEKTSSQQRVAHPPLGDKSKIFLSLLHIELSLKKLSVKAMDELTVGFAFLRQTFPTINETKIK
jgi:hypothetical protein